METILFHARLALARTRLQAREYQAAERQFRTCLLNSSMTEKLPLHAIVELKLDLALACDGSGSRARQKEALLETLKLNLPTAQQLHLQHTLAIAYLNDEEIGSARQFAETAVYGRRKLLGPQHEALHDNIQLLMNICKAQTSLMTLRYTAFFCPRTSKLTTDCPRLQIRTSKAQAVHCYT